MDTKYRCAKQCKTTYRRVTLLILSTNQTSGLRSAITYSSVNSIAHFFCSGEPQATFTMKEVSLFSTMECCDLVDDGKTIQLSRLFTGQPKPVLLLSTLWYVSTYVNRMIITKILIPFCPNLLKFLRPWCYKFLFLAPPRPQKASSDSAESLSSIKST